MTPARATEIIQQAHARAKFGPWSDQIDNVLQPGERDEIRAVWDTMSGSSTFVGALERAARTGCHACGVQWEDRDAWLVSGTPDTCVECLPPVYVVAVYDPLGDMVSGRGWVPMRLRADHLWNWWENAARNPCLWRCTVEPA